MAKGAFFPASPCSGGAQSSPLKTQLHCKPWPCKLSCGLPRTQQGDNNGGIQVSDTSPWSCRCAQTPPTRSSCSFSRGLQRPDGFVMPRTRCSHHPRRSCPNTGDFAPFPSKLLHRGGISKYLLNGDTFSVFFPRRKEVLVPREDKGCCHRSLFPQKGRRAMQALG